MHWRVGIAAALALALIVLTGSSASATFCYPIYPNDHYAAIFVGQVIDVGSLAPMDPIDHAASSGKVTFSVDSVLQGNLDRIVDVTFFPWTPGISSPLTPRTRYVVYATPGSPPFSALRLGCDGVAWPYEDQAPNLAGFTPAPPNGSSSPWERLLGYSGTPFSFLATLLALAGALVWLKRLIARRLRSRSAVWLHWLILSGGAYLAINLGDRLRVLSALDLDLPLSEYAGLAILAVGLIAGTMALCCSLVSVALLISQLVAAATHRTWTPLRHGAPRLSMVLATLLALEAALYGLTRLWFFLAPNPLGDRPLTSSDLLLLLAGILLLASCWGGPSRVAAFGPAQKE